MTKKDFVAIANILSQWADRNPHTTWASYKDLCECFAIYMQQQNPLFDKALFYAACKIVCKGVDESLPWPASVAGKLGRQ